MKYSLRHSRASLDAAVLGIEEGKDRTTLLCQSRHVPMKSKKTALNFVGSGGIIEIDYANNYEVLVVENKVEFAFRFLL